MTDFERCAGSSPFYLGMVDFDCCGVKHKFDNQENTDDDFQPPMKKGKLSLAATSTNPFPFQMPTFSPVINSNGQGTINFTMSRHICPSGSMAIGNKKETIDDLLDGIDIKDIFD